MPTVTPTTKQDIIYVGSWFALELPSAKITGITSISGLNIEMNVVEFTQATVDGKSVTKKMPGVVKYNEIGLKRPLSADKSLWDWAKSIRDGKIERTDGAIVLYDIANGETGRWTFEKAWLSKWSASDLDVGSDDPIMEEVTLQIESLKRDK